MSTNEDTLFILIARPVFPNTDVARSRALYTKLETQISEELERAGSPELKISIQGSFAEQSRRQDELDASIVKGSLLAFIILFSALGLYFRSGRIVIAILLPLFLSTAIALSFAKLVFGYLNIVSAFIRGHSPRYRYRLRDSLADPIS